MILGVGRAAGKVILFGEHAVVYGRPALAVPVTQVWAEARVEAGAPGSGVVICAADLDEEIALRTAAADHPLAAAVRLALAAIREQRAESNSLPDASFRPIPEPDWRITVRSTIPIASGMGSGAAVSAAIMRAIAAIPAAPTLDPYVADAASSRLSPAVLSELVYQVERLYHGTPSGIDNTVIAYGQPVYFVKGRPPEPFAIGRPFTLVIADTGIRSATRIVVEDVRRRWAQEPAHFEALFDRIARIVEAARAAIAAGRPEQLGPLMGENHALLQEMGVSCPELDALVAAARTAGARGAKLSGAGRGGNMIALVAEEAAADVAAALAAAGAARVIVTEIRPPAGLPFPQLLGERGLGADARSEIAR
jgi:mevalonate kinase